MSVSTDNNISIKEYNKISNYKNLWIEIEKKMWYLKTSTISEIVGALGMIKKGIYKHINKLPGSSKLYEKQKISLYRTVHLFRRVLRVWL